MTICSFTNDQCDQIWRNFTLLQFFHSWAILQMVFCIWKKIEPSLASFMFMVVNGHILNKKSSHLVTLQITKFSECGRYKTREYLKMKTKCTNSAIKREREKENQMFSQADFHLCTS